MYIILYIGLKNTDESVIYLIYIN
ncbi:MAG: hypothetical protein RJA85_347, partial [Pseudomonadota bacterium]